MNKKSIVLIALAGLIIVAIILFIRSKTYINPPVDKYDDQKFTGVKNEPLSPNIAIPINQKFELRSSSPITKEEFTITYNVKEAKFIVTINPPFDQNKKVFDTWLKDNNYDKIPSSDFTLNTP